MVRTKHSNWFEEQRVIMTRFLEGVDKMMEKAIQSNRALSEIVNKDETELKRYLAPVNAGGDPRVQDNEPCNGYYTHDLDAMPDSIMAMRCFDFDPKQTASLLKLRYFCKAFKSGSIKEIQHRLEDTK